MTARTPFLALVVVLLFTTACRKGDVQSYRIPKETDPEMPALTSDGSGSGAPPAATGAAGNQDMASTPVATAHGADLTWTAPAAWKAKTGSTMRKGSFAVPGAGGDGDLAITAFPGDVGGELANVNRWRGQLNLPPIGEGELASAVTRVEHNGLAFGLVDLVGPGDKPQRMLGAYVPYHGATWFFKLVGPDTTVAQAKNDFLAFVQTVKPVPHDHNHP